MEPLDMTETARPEPFFIADDHALDLLNSVAAPWGTEIEWLGDGRDLLAWLDALPRGLDQQRPWLQEAKQRRRFASHEVVA